MVGPFGAPIGTITLQDVYDFLSKNLKVQVSDDGEPSMCGGEIPATYGVNVKLLLTNPATGEKTLISEDSCTLD